MDQISNNLKKWLLGISLIILIPTTIHLGIRMISFKINHRQYFKEQQKFYDEFYKKMNTNRHSITRELRKQLQEEWAKTSTSLQYNKEYDRYHANSFIINGIFSLLLFFIGSTFSMPIISASILISANIVCWLNYFQYNFYIKSAQSNHWFGITDTFEPIYNLLDFLELFIILFNLIIVLYYAYIYSEKNINFK